MVSDLHGSADRDRDDPVGASDVEGLPCAAEYDGDQHRKDRAQYAWDVRRTAQLQQLGWFHIRVIAEDRPQDIIDRVRFAWARRENERRAA